MLIYYLVHRAENLNIIMPKIRVSVRDHLGLVRADLANVHFRTDRWFRRVHLHPPKSDKTNNWG